MKLARRKLGWIGIDVGTYAVKVAQVVCNKHGWHLAASAIVPRQQSWPTNLHLTSEVASSLEEIQTARSLQEGYRGARVAASLPMALCDIHRLDRSIKSDPNSQQILRKTLETALQRSAADLQYDAWSETATEKQPAWTQVLAVSQNWAQQLCTDISQAGWSCETIDGLPMVLTRAVSMVHSSTPAPLAALDWGHGRATLCMIERGQPAYVRSLKGCDFHKVLENLTNNLQVSEIEAQQLLVEYGLVNFAPHENHEIAALVQEVIAEPMQQLVEEIKRSFSHYQFVNRSSQPEMLYLIGGGTHISGLGKYLTQQTQVSTQVWQLPTLDSTQEDAQPATTSQCQLAPAIALSALAWEAQ